MAKITSAMSFAAVQASGYVTRNRLKLYRAIAFNPDESQRRGCEIASVSLNGGTTRYAELEYNGLIKVTGYKKCSTTGKTVAVYAITGNVPTEKLQKPPSELHRLRKETEELRHQVVSLMKLNADMRRTIASLANQIKFLKGPPEEIKEYARIAAAARKSSVN